MRRFKQAVTLVEMLITLGIIGIICLFAITTVKPYEKTYKFLYLRAFNVLETAVYNSMLKRDSFPATTNDFCTMLTEYANVAENKCAAGGDLAKNASTFPEANVKLILSNGMYVWIASNGGAPFVKTEKINGVNYTIKYYMTYVDITGSKPPNRVEWHQNGQLADIVAFAVTEASVVIPIGPPEVDTRYMTAVAVYLPYNYDMPPDGNRSAPVTYSEAKSLAWGNSKVDAEVRTWNFASEVAANGPFAVDYTNFKPGVNSTEECTAVDGKVSPCYVKIDNYN